MGPEDQSKLLRPLIGITTKPVADEKYGQSFEYVDAIIRAGGIPVLVPPVGNPAEIYERLDGLILSGGGDIDPSYYGGRAHSAIYGVSKERDEFEIELARVAARGRRPCLPICRGIQVLCVALGGTLIEHIPDETDHSIAHRDPDMKEGKPHKVDITPNSILALALEATSCTVISWHHQAIRDPGPLRVTAKSSDGIIEAVELPGHAWMNAVQWHPEMSAGTDPTQQRLFDCFVKACRS